MGKKTHVVRPPGFQKFGVLMFGMASASLLTELILAQLATVLWGGLIAKYTLTLGVFILALGFGSLVSWPGEQEKKLAWQQTAMVALALLSPWIVLWAGTHLLTSLAWVVAAGAIFAVGFCCGLEFPLLASISENKTGASDSFVFSSLLKMDYLGMGVSSFLFPVFLLKHIGVFQAALLAALINLLLAFFVGFVIIEKQKSSRSFQIAFSLALLLGLVSIVFIWWQSDSFNQLAQSWVIQ